MNGKAWKSMDSGWEEEKKEQEETKMDITQVSSINPSPPYSHLLYSGVR